MSPPSRAPSLSLSPSNATPASPLTSLGNVSLPPSAAPASAAAAASLFSASGSGSQADAAGAAAPNGGLADTLRRQIFGATLPLHIELHAPDLGRTAGWSTRGSEGGVEEHWMLAPRISYLPLLLPTLQAQLVEPACAALALPVPPASDYYFSDSRGALKWHHPLGLQHDLRPSPTLPWRITLHLRGASAERLGTSGEASAAKAAFMGALKSSDFVRHGNTRRVGNLRKEEQDRMWEGVCAHEWGTYQAVASKLLPAVPHDFTLAAASSTASSSATERASVAGSIHSAAPSASAAPGGATAGSLGANAWGASSTSLSPSVASTATGASPAVSSPEAAPPSSGNGTAAAQGQQKDLTARRTPLRIHLPDAPVLMEAAKAWSEDGRALPLSHALSATFPLLFPPTSTFAPERTAARARSLARVYVHGVEMPSETPLPWLGGAAAGADGWVNICVRPERGGVSAKT